MNHEPTCSIPKYVRKNYWQEKILCREDVECKEDKTGVSESDDHQSDSNSAVDSPSGDSGVAESRRAKDSCAERDEFCGYFRQRWSSDFHLPFSSPPTPRHRRQSTDWESCQRDLVRYEHVHEPTSLQFTDQYWTYAGDGEDLDRKIQDSQHLERGQYDSGYGFFQNDGTTNGFAGNMLDMCYAVNEQSWDLLETRTFKLGVGDTNATQAASTASWLDDSSFSKEIKFDFTPYIKGMHEWNDNTNVPTNRNLWMFIQTVYADGSNTGGLTPIELHNSQITKFTDS